MNNTKSNVYSLDHKSDYIEIKVANGDTHVIPISVFRHVASGKLTVNRIEEFIPIYKEITKQWLDLLGYN
jgi:hypothetical protein